MKVKVYAYEHIHLSTCNACGQPQGFLSCGPSSPFVLRQGLSLSWWNSECQGLTYPLSSAELASTWHYAQNIFFSNMDFGNDLKSSCLQGKHSMDLTISRTTESQTYWLPGSSPVLRSSVRPRTWKDGDGMMGPLLPPGGQMRDKYRKNRSLLGWHDATGLVDWRLWQTTSQCTSAPKAQAWVYDLPLFTVSTSIFHLVQQFQRCTAYTWCFFKK